MSGDTFNADNGMTGFNGTTLSGACPERSRRKPFGNTAIGGSSANAFQFTGRENDGTGLYYYRARYYSPTFQRFISQDPWDFTLVGGANLYAYVRNSPLNLTDKLDLTPCDSNSNCQAQALHNLVTCLAVTLGAIGLTEDIAVAGCVTFGGPMALPCALTVIGVYEPPTAAAIGGCFFNYSSGCQ